MQGPTISMGPRDPAARAAVLFSIVENVPIASLNSKLILTWYSAMVLSAAQSFVVLDKVNKDFVHAIARARVDNISPYTSHKVSVEFAGIAEKCLRARLKSAVAVHLASDGWEHFGHHFLGVLAFLVEAVDGVLVRNVYCLGLPYFNNLETHDAEFLACILDSLVHRFGLLSSTVPRVYLTDSARVNLASIRYSQFLRSSVFFPCALHMTSNCMKAGILFVPDADKRIMLVRKFVGTLSNHEAVLARIIRVDYESRKAAARPG